MGKSPSLTLVLGRKEREMKTRLKAIHCFWLPSQVTFSIAAACAAAAISQVGLVGLMSGVFVSVVMLKNSTLQTAAACCAAADWTVLVWKVFDRGKNCSSMS